MHNIRKKLKSKRGITIIAALTFFIIAAILGSVIISAAAASAGRLSHLHREQQAYLTVSSAARLTRDEFKGFKCTFVEVTIDGTFDHRDETYPTTTMSDLLYNIVDNNSKNKFVPESFVISSDDEVFADVKAELVELKAGTSGTNGTLVIKLTSADTENPYIMTLSIPFTKTVNEVSVTVTTDAVDSDGDGEPESPATSTTTVTKTTDYTIGTGTIAKGVPVK